MSPSLLLIQGLSGLAHAMVLFLIASGLSLIFGVTRIVNFAHGSFYMLAAYLTYSFAAALPLGPASFYVAVVAAALATGLVGLVIEVGLLRRVYRAPELYQLLLTFALVLVIADVVRLGWGTENKTGPTAPGLAGSVRIAGQLFATYDLALIVLGPVVALVLWWLFYRTRWGVLIRAATQDREMVAVLGVDQARLFTSVFVLGSCLAGLGGALQVPRQALTNVMDTTIITEAFVVVVVGGMGSVPGAFLAAILIGVIDAFGVLLLPKASLVMIFVVMAVVLIARPWGLLGRPEAQARSAGGSVTAEARAIVPAPLVLALVAALVVVPPFLPRFHVLVLSEILIFALFAGSLHLLMGTGGMVSFGHAATFGLGAYGAALLLERARLPMLVAFALAPVVAAAGAALYGYFCVRLSSIYFAMLTLAFAQIAYAIVHQWYDVTGGDNGLLGVWPPRWLASPVRYYYLALVACAGGLALLAVIGRAPFGLTLRAARDHARRAEAVGIDVRRHQWAAFVVAGFFGGLAGAAFAFLKGSVFPNYLAVPMSVEPLVMVLLGGVQAFAGAAVGAAIYKVLDTVVTWYTDYWQLVIGLILVTLVVAFPRGVLGVLAERRRA
ncbi:MAG: ABC transporter permease [Candidatus Rokubacteria bacterium]|nr:ABC transporter permease [Candidatus Rokubacteria bacterium]MBI3826856.1 ABC transporter permease [Candidatus Rokubacteria bacterium]